MIEERLIKVIDGNTRLIENNVILISSLTEVLKLHKDLINDMKQDIEILKCLRK